jgi:formylglycine-generating enzyme required for sulfatase activity/thiol-disulfide isomerase/thioredoxin
MFVAKPTRTKRIVPRLSRALVWCSLIALSFTITSDAVARGPGIETLLQRWLERPGVKVVVLEVYSDSCEPCKQAAPHWEALRKRYAKDGLMLVALNIDDYESDRQCKTLPWKPDRLICDPDIAEALGVQSVPQSFVWTWQGELLVSGKAHVDEADKAISAYFKRSPRIAVEVVDETKRKRLNTRSIRRFVEAELGRDRKVVVVANERDRKLLRRRAKATHDVRRRDDQRCTLGQALSETAVLRVEVFESSVSMSLQRLDKQCSTTLVVDIPPNAPARQWATDAVYELMERRLRKPAVLPGGRNASTTTRPAPTTPKGPSLSGGSTTAAKGRLIVEGQPTGAVVEITDQNGKTQTGQLPFQAAVAPGKWTIKVTSTGYEVWTKTQMVEVDRTSVVAVTLSKPGILEVVGTPDGAEVQIDGPNGFSGKTGLPATLKDAPTGEYRIRVSRPGYTPYDGKATVTSGGTETVTVSLERVKVASGPSFVAGDPEAATLTRGKAGIEWVRIPGGSFEMGSTDGESYEKPVHTVRIRTFDLMKTEVTVGQYRACVRAGACTEPDVGFDCNYEESGREDHPVNCVDWNQVQAFATWAGGRLPTEAEWEYAARSGGKKRKYPWGNEKPTCAHAVMTEFAGRKGCGKKRTWPVCSKRRGNSRHGVCDLAGNVWEWVQDSWHDSYRGAPSDGSAWAWEGGNIGVRRGGSWYSDASWMRAAVRRWKGHADTSGVDGFRLARSISSARSVSPDSLEAAEKAKAEREAAEKAKAEREAGEKAKKLFQLKKKGMLLSK